MKECCETCRLKLRIEKLDYSKGGCTHTWPEGYICLWLFDILHHVEIDYRILIAQLKEVRE